jgi:hypothetical protein
MYISTWGGGIFKSTDSGNLWTEINTGLSNLKINCLKENANGILLAGSQGDGVYISKDYGASWKESISGLKYKAISSLEITSNGYILVGTFRDGIFLSRDTAKTWENSSSGLKNRFISKLIKSSVGEIFAASYGSGVFVSPNNGISWVQTDTTGLFDFNINSVVITSGNEILIGSKTGGVQYYDKYLYQKWMSPFTPFTYVTALVIDSKNKIYAIGNDEHLYYSTNNGRNWIEIYKIKEVQTEKVFAFKSGKLLSQLSNSLPYFSSDYGETWSPTNLEISQNKPHQILNAVFTNEETYFVGTTLGIRKSNDGQQYSDAIAMPAELPQIPDAVYFDSVVTSMAYKNGLLAITVTYRSRYLNPELPNPLPKYRFFISSDNGETFSRKAYPYIPPSDPCEDCESAISKLLIANDGSLYALAGNSVLYKSTNAGTSWDSLTGYKPNFLFDLAINSLDVIFLSTNKGLLRSQDYGKNWVNKYIINSSKDTIPSSNIVVGTNDYLYCFGKYSSGILTIYDLWYSKNSGDNWISLGGNLNSSENMSLSFDNRNNLYLTSNSLFKHLDSTMLTAPTQILPDTNNQGLGLLPSMKWTKDNFAELYELQVSNRQDFTYLSDYSVQRDTIYTATDSLVYNTEYFWRVRSKYHNSYSPWSQARKFETLLDSPFLISPPDKSTGVDFEPTLVWHKVKNAKFYELQVSESYQFTTFAFKIDSLADSLSLKVPLKADKSYFWRVRAKNATSTSPWSDIWNFKTTFEAPILISPKNDSIDVPVKTKLIWGQVMNSNYYNILLSKNPDFSGETPIKVENAVEFPVSLDYDTKYYWKASVGNNFGYSPYSLPWNFLTIIEPITLVSPVNNSVNQPLKANLQWEPNQKYKNYEILLSETNDFKNIELDSTLNKETVHTSKLKSYQQYFWKVKVKTESRNGEWSEIRSFTTNVDLPMLRFPENNTTNHPKTLTFLWFPVVGAEYYFLQVAKDIDFNNLVISKDSIYASLFEIKEELASDTKYFWRTRAANSDGFSIWSEIWNFTTKVVSVKDEKETLLITPNPASDYITVVIQNIEPLQSIQFLDIFGNRVLNVETIHELSLQRIDVSILPSGVYFLKLNNQPPVKFIKL